MRAACQILAVALLASWPMLAPAQTPTSQPDGRLSDADLASLVSQLGDPLYRTRTHATSELTARLHVDDLTRLAPAFHSTASPERRARLRLLAHDVFVRERSEAEPPAGFLGVGHHATALGVNVDTVLPGSPAEKAGLKPGDLITALNGKPVGPDAEEFVLAISGMRLGDKARLAVNRDGRELAIVATLDSRQKFNLDPLDKDYTREFNAFWKANVDPTDTTADPVGDGVRVMPGGVLIFNNNEVLEGD